jgi:hypothetical protein
MKAKEFFTAITMPFGILGLAAALTLGCDNKEKVLDLEGPGGSGVEVERDRTTGNIDVEVKKKEDKLIDINTPGADVQVRRDGANGSIDVDVDKK